MAAFADSVLFFYNRRPCCGALCIARDSTGGALVSLGQRVFVCFEHNCHIGTFWTSPDRSAWTKYGVQIGVSGYHHNIAYDFLSLRPGLNASGERARAVP